MQKIPGLEWSAVAPMWRDWPNEAGNFVRAKFANRAGGKSALPMNFDRLPVLQDYVQIPLLDRVFESTL